LAIPWLVLVTTGSPTRMGLVAGVAALSHILAGIFGTPWVNRIGVRRTSIITDTGCALAMASVASFYGAGFGLLLSMVAVNGLLAGTGDRAKRVMLAPMAQAAGTPMARVTAIFDGLNRTATIVGASLGGVLIAWQGSLTVVCVDAFSFALCGAIIAIFVRVPRTAVVRSEDAAATAAETAQEVSGEASTEGAAKPEPYFAALRGGFRHLRSDRLLIGIVGMMFVLNLFNQASGVVYIPLWVRDVLGSPVALGFIFGTFALGAIVGNLTFAALATRLPRYLTLVIGYFVGGSPRFLVLAFSHDLSVVLAVMFVCGIATSSTNPTIGALLYQRVPPSLQARVFGLTGAIAHGGLAIGGLVGAWAVAGLGLTGGLVLAGVLYFAATLTPVWGYRTWRQIDDLPAPEPARRDRPQWREKLVSVRSTLAAAVGRLGTRLGLRPADDPRIPPLTLVLAYRRDGWTVRARRGRRRVLTRHAITTTDALKKIAMLDVPNVYGEAEQIHAAELARAERRLAALRSEMADVEARLAELRRAR
jgi:MFS family permease